LSLKEFFRHGFDLDYRFASSFEIDVQVHLLLTHENSLNLRKV